jgi:hypothetical protein
VTQESDRKVIVGLAAQEKADEMEKLATDLLNWTALFRDPLTGELWKQTFPWPAAHGGGPPQLEITTRQRALLEFDLTEEDLESPT